jgi:hypothetical protein
VKNWVEEEAQSKPPTSIAPHSDSRQLTVEMNITVIEILSLIPSWMRCVSVWSGSKRGVSEDRRFDRVSAHLDASGDLSGTHLVKECDVLP